MVYVIIKSAILILAQFNISFMVQNQITVSLIRAVSYHGYYFGCRILHNPIVYCDCEAVRSAILATAWHLFLSRAIKFTVPRYGKIRVHRAVVRKRSHKRFSAVTALLHSVVPTRQ